MDKKLIKQAVQVWRIGDCAYAIVENSGADGGYIVRVIPNDHRDSFWLEDNAPYETESGAAWNILNYLESRA